MKFKGVIRSIKPNQTYKSTSDEYNLKEVSMDANNKIILEFENEGKLLVINPDQDFKLKRKEVSFDDAYKALQEGKEIESVLNSNKYVKSNIVFYKEEIENLWYIND